MASKKYSLLTGILCLLASYGFSQTTTTTGPTGGYDPADSSIVPSRRMPQHTEFLNGTYNFPAKPRNQWEIGIKGGAFTASTDVPALFPTFGGGLHIRKALGYVFSLRLEYMYGVGKGLSYLPASQTAYQKMEPWQSYTGPVFYNYRTKVQDLALEGIVTLNNIRFHKAKTGFNVYGIAGIGGTVYDTKVNARGDNGQPYNFTSIDQNTGSQWKNRKEIRDDLKDLMDDSYETDAQNHGGRRPKLFGNTFKPVGHIGAGIAFKLSNRINLAVEDRYTILKDDLLDGVQYQETGSLTPDYDSYNYFTVGLNFNLGSKATEPLYWLNPLDYAYSEIRNPRLMRLPKPVLPDADGDGVTDQFDLEQTPQGVPVDSHGVSRDTDGDGVPDSRDKELVTPTYCQPVDADGVGKCPCPEGCGRDTSADACATNLGALPSITFTGNSIALNNDSRSLLASVAARLRQNPECRVVVIGYCASSKAQQQRSWDRVNAVINHLVEKEGISGDRFIFNYGQEGGDCNTVDLRAAATGEEGPNNVPAPHPNLRR